MKPKRHRQKTGIKNIQHASLPMLEKHLAPAESTCAKLESMIAEDEAHARSAISDKYRLENDLSLVESKLSHLREIRRPKKGIISGLFGLTEIPSEIMSQISSLEDQQKILCDKVWKLRRIGHNIPAYKTSLEETRALVAKLQAAIGRKRKKEEATFDLRAAAAAANQTKTRIVGSSVKRKLPQQPWCPYCGEPLNSEPHADHIYPVSKGGRSVPRNMVYVCASCNSTKRDLTLTTFIRKYNLDRGAIEQRLQELGKDF